MYLNYQLIDDLVQPEIGVKISHRYTVRVSKWFLANTDCYRLQTKFGAR